MLLASIGARAEVTIDGNKYDLDNNKQTATFKKPNTNTGDFVIPSEVTYNNVTYTVTSIGTQAFSSGKFTSIIIPNTITSIGYWAFQKCEQLTNIDIPSSVTSISTYAFSGCKGLTSLTIPASVTSIGGGITAACTSLTSLVVDAENPNYDSRNNCNAIIRKNGNGLVAACKMTQIPSEITSIDQGAFYGFNTFTSIEIPAGVTVIGADAFRDCYGLTSINIPENVKSIPNYCFFNCAVMSPPTKNF